MHLTLVTVKTISLQHYIQKQVRDKVYGLRTTLRYPVCFLHGQIKQFSNKANVYFTGYSFLQDGPLPCFFSESQIKRLFLHRSVKTQMKEQFLEGFSCFGLTEVLHQWFHH